jgi:hypothetical protein
MKPTSYDDDLLRRFLHGEVDGALVSELGERLKSDPALASECARELGFSELIRQALAGDPVEAGRALAGAMESVHLPIEELLDRVREGSASPFECDQVAKHLWDSPDAVGVLRHQLAEDEWMRLAVSASKSGQAFVESLETRMWAETKQDHFVEDFAKRFERELAAVPDAADRTMSCVSPAAGRARW